MANKKPDLEEIAKRLSELEENLKLKEIEPKISEAYNSVAKYTDKKGRVRYRHDFSEEPEKAEELADKIFDALSEHIPTFEYGMESSKYDELKGYKSEATGASLHDVHAHFALGMSRHQLKLLFDKSKKNLSLSNILAIIQKQLQDNYVRIKQEDIFAPIKDEHLEYVKEYIGKKVKEHKLPEKDYEVKKKYRREEVLPILYELAKTIHGK